IPSTKQTAPIPTTRPKSVPEGNILKISLAAGTKTPAAITPVARGFNQFATSFRCSLVRSSLVTPASPLTSLQPARGCLRWPRLRGRIRRERPTRRGYQCQRPSPENHARRARERRRTKPRARPLPLFQPNPGSPHRSSSSLFVEPRIDLRHQDRPKGKLPDLRFPRQPPQVAAS